MGIAPSEARDLTLYEYGALLHHWNQRQASDGAGQGDTTPVEHPSDEELKARWAELEAAGIGVVMH